jgi:hypothetical protein
MLEGTSSDIARFLASKAQSGKRTTYKEVAEAIGWGNPKGRGLGNHLEKILRHCNDNQLPPLTTILVPTGQRRPAPDAMSYITAVLGNIDIDQAQREVFEFNWSTVPELSSDVRSSPLAGDVWLTSFWGFDPKNWGCIGFATESKRRYFLARATKGALVAIYVTKGKGPDNMRGKVVGIMEVSGKTGHAKDFISGDRWEAKESDPDARGKWLYAVEVTRAWRIAEEDWKTVDKIFPKAYGSAHPEFIGSQGVRIDPDEARRLFSLTVYEVPVYGQTRSIDGAIQPFENALRPSKAVYPSKEPYWVGETDGPKHIYILKLEGDAAAYLDRPRSELADRMIIKVGFSRSPHSRCEQIQSAYPAGAFAWKVLKPDPVPEEPPYSCAEVAIAGEDAMKAKLVNINAESLGREFFLADANAIQQAWGAGSYAAQERQGATLVSPLRGTVAV